MVEPLNRASSYHHPSDRLGSVTLESSPSLASRTLCVVKQALVFSAAFFAATAVTYQIATTLILPASATYLMKISGVVAIYLFHGIPSLIPKMVARSRFLTLTNPDRKLKGNLSTRQGEEETSSILKSFPYEKTLEWGFRLAVPSIMLGSLGALQLGFEVPSLQLVCNLLASWSTKQKLMLLPAGYLLDRALNDESLLLLRNDPTAKKVFEKMYRFAVKAELTYIERSYFFRLTLTTLTEKSLNPIDIITSMRDEGHFTEERIAEKFVDLWNGLIFSELTEEEQTTLYISLLKETFFRERVLQRLCQLSASSEGLKPDKEIFDIAFTYLEENPTHLSAIEDKLSSFIGSFLALIDNNLDSESKKLELVRKIFNAIQSQCLSNQVQNKDIYLKAIEQLNTYLEEQRKMLQEEFEKRQSDLPDQT